MGEEPAKDYTISIMVIVTVIAIITIIYLWLR